MTRLVLGSASPGRLKVLRQAGIDPLVVVSGVDEDAVIAASGSNASPGDVVRALARPRPSRSPTSLDDAVAADCVVIGCDSMLYFDGQLRGKPASSRRGAKPVAVDGGPRRPAVHRPLRDPAARRQRSSTGVSETSFTTVHFATPSAADLDAYIASGEPLQRRRRVHARRPGRLVHRPVDGDPSSVIGISLPLTRALLQRVGLSIAALWA